MNVGKFEKVSKEQFFKDYSEISSKQGEIFDIDETCFEDIILPYRATKGSAGYDFVLPFGIRIKAGEFVRIPTGIRAYLEDGYVLNIYPRSSLGFKYQMALANTVGIIDSDYYNADNEGHIIVGIVNKGDKEIILKKGDRFVQGIISAYYTMDEQEVNEMRTGGFGSSDK